MAAQPLARRVDRLEQRMDALETLPSQVANLATQFSQFREEVAREFIAVRQELRDGDEETRRFMRVLHEEVIARLKQIQETRPRSNRR